ncbi:MAG TPA: heat-inducible transcriptional repressor HrcA [Candidatus Baltobacteraceae bacterium]|jgi:heat-inducible transcriptional repressor|nr:heat-inducible transcriptional repressor HrcA [Candidatus Baltobacteraceae bacterium]
MKSPGPRPEFEKLDKRKAFILSTIVYEYVATAEPVGSNTLTQKYNLGVSSATIRNEMAELELGGYLVQPHASAGRIPSDAGYRTYVDQLMRPEPLSAEDRRRVRDEFREASRELGDLIEQTARMLGQMSRSVAFMLAPQRDTQTFAHVQLIALSERTGLAVVVTSLGVAAQHFFEFSPAVSADDLTRLSDLLNARLRGKTLRELLRADLAGFVREADAASELTSAIEAAFRNAVSSDDITIASSGTQHLLDQPEFQDLRKLRSILRIVEEQRSLYDLVADSFATDGPSVKIGHELSLEEVAECSVVTVPYRTADGMVGLIAILGPRRMPYARLMSLASDTADSLNLHLSNPDTR